MLHHAGESRCSQNIQVSKGMGENVSVILWKKLNRLFGQPNIIHRFRVCVCVYVSTYMC